MMSDELEAEANLSLPFIIHNSSLIIRSFFVILILFGPARQKHRADHCYKQQQ